jgi:hypothetical protein
VQLFSCYPSPAHTCGEIGFSNDTGTKAEHRNRLNSMQDFRIQLYQYQGQEFVKKKIKTIFSTENYKFHFSCTRNAIHVSKYVQLNNTLLLYCCLTFAYNFPLMWFRFLALYKNN